jgi:hypothetical protein
MWWGGRGRRRRWGWGRRRIYSCKFPVEFSTTELHFRLWETFKMWDMTENQCCGMLNLWTDYRSTHLLWINCVSMLIPGTNCRIVSHVMFQILGFSGSLLMLILLLDTVCKQIVFLEFWRQKVSLNNWKQCPLVCCANIQQQDQHELCCQESMG